MKKNYKKSFLLFVHIILVAALVFFTLIPLGSNNLNIVGLLVSMVILFLYFISLKKSASFFNQGRVGIAYFLTIGGFFSLMFVQFINCTQNF